MHGLVECPAAQWIFRYTNGYNITLSGPLTAEIVVLPLPATQTSSQPQLQQYILKLEKLVFDAMTHDKYLAVDAIQGIRIPDSPQGAAMSPGAIGNPNGTPDDPNKYEEPRHIYESVVIPAEPINAFGIPQATMRCLEVCSTCCVSQDVHDEPTESIIARGKRDADDRSHPIFHQQEYGTLRCAPIWPRNNRIGN